MTENSTMYAGLDLGNRYTHYCVLDAAGEVIDRGRFRTQEAALRSWSAGHPEARVALETGSHCGWMARLLTELGHRVLVANARQVAAISRNPRKCDEADAELLARLLRADPSLLRPVTSVLERDTAALAIVRARAQLVETRTSLINHVRGVARASGVVLPRCDAAYFGRVVSDLPESLRGALEGVMKVIGTTTAEIAELDRTIEQICTEAYPETAVLRTVPGVGPVVALYFVLVVGRPERFAERRDVAAYLGLVPRRDQSGDSDRALRIAKVGDTYLRQLMVTAAQSHLRYGTGALHTWAMTKAAGGPTAKKRAVVALARKLSVLLHAMWSNTEPFRPWPKGEPEVVVMKRNASTTAA